MQAKCVLLLLGFFWLTQAQADQNQPATLSSADFSYLLPIQISSKTAVQSIVLPVEFYNGITSKRYADMRVFDAHGELTPYFLKQNNVESSNSKTEQLNVFPLHANQKIGSDFKLNIQLNKTQTQVQISDDADTSGEQQGKITAYIFHNPLATADSEMQLKQLKFDWEKTTSNSIGKYSLDGSHDLYRWTRIDGNIILSDLSLDNNRILKNTLVLNKAQYPYLKLAQVSGSNSYKIKQVTATYKHTETVSVWKQLDIDHFIAQENGNEFYFEVPGLMPIEKMDFLIGDNNAIYKGQIFSRENENANWSSGVSFFQYKLHFESELISSDPLQLNSKLSRSRNWMLQFEQPEQPKLERLPTIRFSWRPHQLTFLVNNPGTYTLAFGNPNIEHQSRVGQQSLIRLHDQLDDLSSSKIEFATLGQLIHQPDAVQISSANNYIAWRKWGLWAILLISVAVMGFMARNLIKQLQTNVD